MHTGTKDNSRLGYAKGGKIQCMAEGGLVQQIKAGVNRLVGNNPTAMAQRGRSETADAPPPATTTATEPVLKAKGGPIPKPAKGAPPHPEAMGTDTVPIMGTPGEFMVRKPAVDKIEAMAPGLLDALNSMGDDKPKLGRVKRRRRGKRKGYQDGGSIFDEYRNPRPISGTPPPTMSAVPQTPNAPAPYVNHRAPSGPPAMPPPLQLGNSVPPPGTAVATTPPRPNFTMGGTPPVVPAVDPVTDVRPKYNPANGAPEAKAWQESRKPAAAPAAAAPAAAPAAPQSRLGRIVRTAGNAVRPTAVGLSAIPEALDVADVAMNPAATGIDVATQAAQGLGRLGAAGAGAAGGAALGAMTGPLAPLAVPIGALAGGAAGYWGANKAIEAGRTAVGMDPRAPVDRLGQIAQPLPPTGAGAGRGFVNPAAVVPASTPGSAPTAADGAAAAPVAPPSNITRVGNSYSGPAGISGPVTINGKTPGGGFVGNAGTGAPVRLGANPYYDQALSDARDQAQARGDFNAVRRSYGGDFGAEKVDPIQALINNGRPMTTRKAAAIAQLQAARAQAEGAAADRGIAAGKAGADRESVELSNREKKGLLSAQEAYANAKTPEERAAAEQRLRAVQGKYDKEAPNRFTVVPGGQEIGADGIPVTRPASVLNNQTGEFVPQPSSAPRALPRGLKVGAPTKQADGTYNAAGKTVVIKGGKITEIK